MSNKGVTAPDANLGRRLLDQYVLVEKIGEGGMGAVYLADQPTMGRRAVVNRDLKPSNVMLVTRGRDDEFVKVLDFGIAKVRGVALTSSGMVFGTPEYMSPEQLRGRELDGRSDLYGLGVVLFEMLTGRLPFAAETPEQYMTAHLELLPPSLSQAGL